MRIASRMNNAFIMLNLAFGVSGSDDRAYQQDERGKDVFKIKVVSDRCGCGSLHRYSFTAPTGRDPIHNKR